MRKRERSDFWQGPLVYLLRSFGDCESIKNGGVDRMTLHPRVSTLSTYAAARGEAFTVPHRVAYRPLPDSDLTGWRYSCLSLQCPLGRAGVVIGDGSDDAALAWLLEGEVRR